MMYKLYNLSFFFLILLATVANAANGPQITGYQSGSLTVDKTYHYRTTLLDQNFRPATDKTSHIIDIGYTVHLDYVFKWKLSILMGEPVVIGWVSYKPTQLHSLNHDIQTNVFRNEKLLKKIGLTEFTMEVRLFLDPNNIHDKGAIFVVDAGSASKPYIGYSSRDLTAKGSLFSQFSSFNTPGSPDWDKLFINISSAAKAKKYFTDITTSTIKRNHSYYRYDVEKVGIDSSNIDQAIYKYLQGLEKKIRDKKKTEQKKLQEQNKKQVDEFDDALGQTESVSSDVDDFLSEESTSGADTLEALLAETENSATEIKKITNTLNKYTDKNKNVIHSKIAATTTGDVWVDGDTDLMWYYPIPKEGGAFVHRNTCYPAHICKRICDNLKIDNYSDWRLPSVYDVMTLFNPKRTTVPNHNALSHSMDRYIDLYPKAPGTKVGTFTRNYQDGSIFKEPLGSRISKDKKEYHDYAVDANHGRILTSNTFRKTFKQTSLHYFLIYIDSGDDGIGIHTGNSTHITCIRDSK